MIKHRCRNEAVGVQHRSGLLGGGSGMQTIVLWRCVKCGVVDTTILDGKWTLDQILTGRQPEPVLPAPPRRAVTGDA